MEQRLEQLAMERSRELVLSPNEFSHISDTTKGNINCYVGPVKLSLATSDKLVLFSEITKKFEEVASIKEATQVFRTAPENWYIVLKNPSKDGSFPKTGTSTGSADLLIGKKINISGPISFALFPGQMCKVIEGHRLRSNEYLLVQIYDVEAAKKGWDPNLGEGDGENQAENFVSGQKLIIRGDQISFYIPPTGIEVIPDENGQYVRDAVTLERLEYCILLGEDGQKHYERGPKVVFPEPDQQFIAERNAEGKERIKFAAIELSEISGLYVKVIAPYQDEEAKREYREGEEIFLTGKDKIYFPRAEHAIISYNGRQRIHSTAIPSGKGHYLLNRKTGNIALIKGPTMLLPDPRQEVIVRRILSDKECTLLYPGNAETIQYNRALREQQPNIPKEDEPEAVSKNLSIMGAALSANSSVSSGYATPDRKTLGASPERRSFGNAPTVKVMADTFHRAAKYSSPRTIVLNEKYQGAVGVDIWSGYAVQIVKKDGTRRVVTGPTNVLLEYDEMLEFMALSMGKPKSNNGPLKETAFLMTQGNKVSDIVDLVTKDLVPAKLHLKYRVNFEGADPSKWFQVSNYVQLLCDHARSRLKAVARKVGIAALRAEVTEIVRDTLLGARPEQGERPGMLFTENHMRVFDIEVLDLHVVDESVQKLMAEAQLVSIRSEVDYIKKVAESANSEQTESLTRKIAKEKADTQVNAIQLARKLEEIQFQLKEGQQARAARYAVAEKESEIEIQRLRETLLEKENALNRAAYEFALEKQKNEQALHLAALQAKTDNMAQLAAAFSPQLIDALNTLSDKQTMLGLTAHLSELAVIEGKGITEVAKKFLDFLPESFVTLVNRRT